MWPKAYRWLKVAGEWLVLLPLWRRLIPARNGHGAAAITTGGLWLVAILTAAAIASGGRDEDRAPEESHAQTRASAAPRRTSRPAISHSPSPEATGIRVAIPHLTETPGPAPAPPPPPAVSVEAAAPPAPGQVLTVVSSSTYADGVGDLHVAGEVRNNGSDFMEFVEITGTFFGAAEQVAASEFTFTHADIVAPGEVAGFDLVVGGGASLGVSRYQLAVQGEVTAERPVSGLAVQEESSSIDAGGDLRVVGTVVNQSAGAVEFVKVIGTFYGPDGAVVRSDYAYTELDEVPAGGADTFELIVAEGGSAVIVRHELKVEAFPL